MLVSFLRMNCKALLEQEGMLVSFEQAHGAKPSALPHHQKSFNGSALVPFVHLSVVHVHCNMCVCASLVEHIMYHVAFVIRAIDKCRKCASHTCLDLFKKYIMFDNLHY
jgi:hypothetical protein